MTEAPLLSVVVIGRNEGERLLRCLASVRAMRDPGGAVELIYVDSSSSDRSPAQAEALGARVLIVHPERPSAALGRNAGWRAAQAPTVLFLDGDTVLDADFVADSLAEFADPRVAVVWGHRRELFPEASVFNRVLDLDWVYPPGRTEFCGGDALMRRSVMIELDGFDETLIAGEEPELCRRMREKGYVILHVDRPMTGHDLAMTSWRPYWRRAFRAGHAYAEVAARFANTDAPLWRREVRRNRVHGTVLLTVLAGGAVASMVSGSFVPLLISLLFFAALAFRTALKVGWKSADPVTRLLYGIHSHLQQIPILIGQLAWRLDQLKGRRRRLIEYK